MIGRRGITSLSGVLTITFGVLGMTGDPLWLIGCLLEAAITGWLIADLTHTSVNHRITLHHKETHL